MMMLDQDVLPSVQAASGAKGGSRPAPGLQPVPGPVPVLGLGPGSGANDDEDADVELDLERLACVTCRSRKLKCDRAKPACVRCTRLKSECVYPESRRKPASKRRNVKELEERLGQ